MSIHRLLLLLAAALPAATHAQWHDVGELARLAEGFAREHVQQRAGRIEVSVGRIDPATRVSRCDAVQPFVPANAPLWGNGNVGLRCARPQPWTLFVPVSVRVFAEVVVTSRPVGRHQLLGEADLARRTLDLTQQPLGLITDPAAAAGRITRAALPAGAALRADMLRAPFAVSQGQQVRVLYVGETIHVSSEGRSLSNAAVGELAQVRTPSGKVIRGIVREPGVIEVK
jgi:flagella basal body P-ring formation protein FlgA